MPQLIRRDKTVFLRRLLWILLFLCLALRLSYPQQFEFKADESTAIRLARENISDSGPVLKGLRSSTGLYNPPFFIYLLSLPVRVSDDPVFVTYFVIFLNLCGLAVFYVFLRRLLPQDTALMVLLLFASSPWSILYSRKIWAQDCLFPFVILFYLVILSQLNDYRRHRSWLLFLLLAVISQLHMSAWFLPLPIIVWFLLFRIEMRFGDILVGLAILTLVYWPYIRFLTGSEPSGLSFQPFFAGIPGTSVSGASFSELPAMAAAAARNAEWSFVVTGATGFAYVLGNSGLRAFTAAYPVRWLHPLFALYYVLAAAGLAYAFKATVSAASRRRLRPMSAGGKLVALLLLIFFGVHLSYFLLKVPAYPHYSIVFYPILPLFTGFLIQACNDSKITWLHKVISTAALLVVVANLAFTLAFFEFVRRHPHQVNGDYGPPYAVTRHSVETRSNE